MNGVGARLWCCAVKATARLEADRAQLTRFVDTIFRCADDIPAAVLRTSSGRLPDELERRR
jgi:hypothetical protein